MENNKIKTISPFIQTTISKSVEYEICKENNCKSKAEIDYNGYNHWVCKYHYEKLSDYFDEEYQ